MIRIVHYVIKENSARVFALIIFYNKITLLICQRLLDLLITLIQIRVIWPGEFKQIGFRKPESIIPDNSHRE